MGMSEYAFGILNWLGNRTYRSGIFITIFYCFFDKKRVLQGVWHLQNRRRKRIEKQHQACLQCTNSSDPNGRLPNHNHPHRRMRRRGKYDQQGHDGRRANRGTAPYDRN